MMGDSEVEGEGGKDKKNLKDPSAQEWRESYINEYLLV